MNSLFTAPARKEIDQHLYRLAFTICDKIFGQSFYFKARSSFAKGFSWHLLNFSDRLFRPSTPLQKNEHVVVVGAGVSALSFLETLTQLGHSKITLVHQDELFGGVCVNSGCMPSEYFQKIRKDSSRKEKLMKFLENLKMQTRSRFEALNLEKVKGTVQEVHEKTLQLSDGQSLSFDRLILATGSTTSGELANLNLPAFWKEPEGPLVILSNNHLGALALGEIASAFGTEVHVVFTENVAFSKLPSVEEYKKNLLRKGIKIHSKVTSPTYVSGNFSFKKEGKDFSLLTQSLLEFYSPQPNLPIVDKKNPTIFDLNLEKCSLRGRDDIFLLGDAVGLFSAAEGDWQGRQLAHSLFLGEKIDLSPLRGFPLCIHGEQSLAMVGDPRTLFEANWKSLDFKKIGWSLAHETEGKLWYLAEKQKIKAIHILHRDAQTLIAVAAALLPYAVGHPRWAQIATHPSAAEIFKLLAVTVMQENTHTILKTESSKNPEEKIDIYLPSLYRIRNEKFFQENFSELEIQTGLLDPNPQGYFSVLAALKLLEGKSSQLLPYDAKMGYRASHRSDLKYEFIPGNPVVKVTLGNRTAVVALHER